MNLDGNRATVASPDQGRTAARISREIVQLNAKLFGRGPVRARTFLEDTYAVCLLESVFTKAERNLIHAGRLDEVQSFRNAMAPILRPEMSRIVEEATGRSVRGCTSAIDIDVDASTNVFLFS